MWMILFRNMRHNSRIIFCRALFLPSWIKLVASFEIRQSTASPSSSLPRLTRGGRYDPSFLRSPSRHTYYMICTVVSPVSGSALSLRMKSLVQVGRGYCLVNGFELVLTGVTSKSLCHHSYQRRDPDIHLSKLTIFLSTCIDTYWGRTVCIAPKSAVVEEG